MIDYGGEKLAQELENARNELYKQITSVGTKLQLLWEVVRTFIVFTIPILTGIGVTFVSQCYLPRTLAIILSSISNGITIGLVFLNITPLNVAINNYVESKVYTPDFMNCPCKTCHDRNNCSQEKQGGKKDKQDETAEQKETTESDADNDQQCPRDSYVNVNSSFSDSVSKVSGDNNESLRKRNHDVTNSKENNEHQE